MDMARASAATLVWGNLDRQINSRDATAATLRAAAIAVYGVSRNRSVLTALATNRINDVLALLRRYTPFPAREYGRLDQFLKDSYAASTNFPPDLFEWLRLAEQLRRELSFGWDAILATSVFLHVQGIPIPSNMGVLSPADLQPLTTAAPNAQLIRTLWSEARSAENATVGGCYLIPPHPMITKESLAKAAQAHTSQLERTGALVVRTTAKHHLPRSFGLLGPAHRIKMLKSAALNTRVSDRFVFDPTSADLLKQVKGSLPGILSAYRFYVAFSELRKAPSPFPAKEDTALERSAVFGNTATYGNYISLLGKCCFFLRYDTAWVTRAVRHVAKGLKKCRNRSFRLPNFIRSQLMIRIIDHETFSIECAQAAFLSFLCSFRVPSETLQLVRTYSSDTLEVFPPQPEKALIGVRLAEGAPFLFANLAWRKNLTSGCILRRPSFCQLAATRAASLCPVRAIWPLIRQRVAPGEPLFKAMNRRNLNRTLKAIMARLSVQGRNATVRTLIVGAPLKS